MIDWNRVVELRDEIGCDDFDEIVALFLSEVEERLTILEQHSTKQEIGDDLHFLKGSALNLGFVEFAKLCSDGETCVQNDGALVCTNAIQSAYAESKDIFLRGLQQKISA